MSNIYNIQESLLAVFAEIEENGGELTSEIEEQLTITQEEFNNKIKSYTGVVKMLENDIVAIKEEVARLNDFKKSKEKTIEKLKKIMINAVELFGNDTKSGGKFIDYGTGKVSVRYTEAVEVDEDATNRFINRLITGLKWYQTNNQLHTGLVDYNDILDFVNTKSPDEETDNIDIDKFTVEDINRLSSTIDLDIDVKSLISTEKGINLIKALFDYNNFEIKVKIDKKGIKEDAKQKDCFIPVYADIITNKSLTVK